LVGTRHTQQNSAVEPKASNRKVRVSAMTDADKAEQEVLAQSGSGPARSDSRSIVALGPKKIYVFKDMKVMFK
jgi:hypothetical protein